MIPDKALSWYEANLPANERKMRGHFSTPPSLVNQILDACGYTSERDLGRLRVLDPACGSGNFLNGATQRLLEYGKERKLTRSRMTRLVQRNVWGFDPDPVACFLAEMQLRHTLSEHFSQQPLEETTLKRAMKVPHLHIHQADGLAFPWEKSQNVDLFLANPPYLASKNTDLSGYRSTQQRGQADSYLLFLSLALQVVRPKGWIGLILPDPVLARANAAQERQRLLAETTIHQLWHLADVFTAYVGAVIIVAQKCPPRRIHQIVWKREHWHQEKSINADTLNYLTEAQELAAPPQPIRTTVAQILLSNQPQAELRYLLSHRQGTLIERMHSHLHKKQLANAQAQLAFLGDYVIIRRGEELGKDSLLLSQRAPQDNEDWYPTLRGGTDIQPYCIPQAQYWLPRANINKHLERYLAPKLLVVKSMGRLQATLDLQGHIVLQTLYLLQLRADRPRPPGSCQSAQEEEDELYFLLALLNSRLLQEYVYVLHTAYKWVQPQIEQHVLKSLPIPIFADAREKGQISQRARLLMYTCSEVRAGVELKTANWEIYEEQERAISALYEVALQGRRALPLPQDIADKGVKSYG